MMNKVIQDLVKKELTLEEKVQAELDKRFKTLELDLVLNHPVGELSDFTSRMIDEVFMKFALEYVTTGVIFADTVKRKKTPPVVVVNGSD